MDQTFWISSRAAGITAFVLLSTSVVMGVVMATRLAPPSWRPVIRLAHERIALIALGALVAHGALLLGDTWLNPRLTQLLIPFTLDYRPQWTGLGVLAGYTAIGLSLSFYARRSLPPGAWRKAHRLVPVAWVLAAIHALGAGTDAGALALQVPLALTIAACVTMLGYRWLVVPPAPVAVPHRPAPRTLPPLQPLDEAPAERLPARRPEAAPTLWARSQR